MQHNKLAMFQIENQRRAVYGSLGCSRQNDEMQRSLKDLLGLVFLIVLCAPQRAKADIGPPYMLTSADAQPGLACRRAIMTAARQAGVPDHLMSAIARIESGRRGPDGQVQPWPWSINAEGVDHIYDTREQAIAAVRALQAQGVRSIDVGCMQVNLLHHPNAFASLELAFDPAANAAYAAGFLMRLFGQTGSWTRATADYHSATPEKGAAYQAKVAGVMAEETAKDIAMPGLLPAAHSSRATLASSGGGAIMLGNRAEAARVIPMAGAGQSRDLDAYRSAPVRVASRLN